MKETNQSQHLLFVGLHFLDVALHNEKAVFTNTF